MRISILSENTSRDCFTGEHGLCLLVETGDKTWLVDTGASGLFLDNAGKLGLDLTRVDGAFLSHAHYDHSGGYPEFFAVNHHAPVYLQKAACRRCYYKILGTLKKDIGIPGGILDTYKDRFVFVEGLQPVDEGVYTLSHTTPQLEKRGERAHMYMQKDNHVAPDDFSHEQTVVFSEADGLVVINSCSHGGVENIIEEVKAAFPDRPIKAFIGGFHMMGGSGVDSSNFPREEVQTVARQLTESSPALFYSGHCTGNIAFPWLKEVLGDRLIAMHAGMVIHI